MTAPRNPPPPLLESLTRDTLDPGYARAAKRKAAGQAPTGRSSVAWLIAGVLVVALLLAVAFRSAQAGSAGNNQARDALVADVQQAQAEQSALLGSAADLGEEVRSAQAAAGGGALAQLSTLEEMNAMLAVSGPGLSIALDDPDAASGNGAVLDRDLQLLVNSLWSAGAEAIAVNGVRLRVTSAIRQAGGAILVDNRPVSWPMTIEAIGDPSAIHQRFIDTPGFGRFATFTQLYGVTFDVVAVDSVSLPAAAQVDPHYASGGEPTPATESTVATTATTS